MNYERILVAVDFSPASAQALREAVRLGSFDMIPVQVLHVIDQRVLENLEHQVVVDQDRTLSEALRRLEAFAREHAAGYPHLLLEPVLGHPFRTVIQKVNTDRPSILLLGSRGTSNDPHRLGALASKCLRKAPVPVLIVDDRQREPFSKVVCAVDYSDTSKRGIQHAIHIANLDQAHLDFLHVYIPPSSFQSPESGIMLMGFEGIADYPQAAEQSLRDFVEPLASQIQTHPIRYSVVDHMSVGRGIVNHLKETAADLLILGTHGRTGWRNLLLGTTAEHIFHKIPCSTLAVKPEEFTYTLDS